MAQTLQTSGLLVKIADFFRKIDPNKKSIQVNKNSAISAVEMMKKADPTICISHVCALF
jgi:hypothetical protein